MTEIKEIQQERTDHRRANKKALKEYRARLASVGVRMMTTVDKDTGEKIPDRDQKTGKELTAQEVSERLGVLKPEPPPEQLVPPATIPFPESDAEQINPNPAPEENEQVFNPNQGS